MVFSVELVSELMVYKNKKSLIGLYESNYKIDSYNNIANVLFHKILNSRLPLYFNIDDEMGIEILNVFSVNPCLVKYLVRENIGVLLNYSGVCLYEYI